MAISLNTNLHHPSLSCGTKLYSGLKLQSPCLFATGRPNLTADFFSRINKSLQCGTRNSKPTRSRVGMMEFLVKELGNGLIYGMHCDEFVHAD
ncbi:hypothetical protein V6Z11_D08G208900 [Gossypium hirsutum]